MSKGVNILAGYANDPRKLLLLVAGLAALALLIAWIIKKVGNAIDGSSSIEPPDPVFASRLTYPISYYVGWATQLETAMQGLGTDEDAVYGVFKRMKNMEDMMQLDKAFGERPYRNRIGIASSKGLSAWIKEELDNSEITHLNNIIASNNINYSF